MMLRLIVQNGSLAGEQIEIESGRQESIRLGCGEGCDLRFLETEISSLHALIVSAQGQFYLVDRESDNGTFVNGRRTDQALLRDSDIIQLGPFGPRLEVIIGEPAGQPGRGPETGLPQAAPSPLPPTARGIIRQTADNLGLYHPSHDSGAAPKPVTLGCLMQLCALVGLAVFGLTILNLGLKTALISSLIAIIPAIIYLGIFLWLDRFDPEPPATLALAFSWGATVSIFFSGIFNEIFGAAIGDHATGIISAPIIEEGCKGLGVLLIALLFRDDFDSVVDGIVYAGVVALGFATVENVDYYGRSLAESGLGGVLGTFVIRGVLAPFSHVLFTCMTGIGCGIARETHNLSLKIVAPFVGYAAAMFLHGLWNALASFGAEAFFTGYFLLEVPLFLLFILVVIYLVKREGRILRQTLAAEVERGLITPEQLAIAISVFRRSGWMASAFGNPRLFTARRQFLRNVAKLGLCHWHKDRATEAHQDTGSLGLIAKLQAEVLSLRDQVG